MKYFYFYDEPGAEAKRETRVWTLTPARKDGREVLSAKASDVPEATTMEWAGNAIHIGLYPYAMVSQATPLTWTWMTGCFTSPTELSLMRRA